MRKHGDSNADLAKALGIHSQTVISRKINNWQDVRFNYAEISVMIYRYELLVEDVKAIFGDLIEYYASNYKYI